MTTLLMISFCSDFVRSFDSQVLSDRLMSTETNLGTTYMVHCCGQMIFRYHPLRQSSPCWLEPSPDYTALIHRRNTGQQCPPAALP